MKREGCSFAWVTNQILNIIMAYYLRMKSENVEIADKSTKEDCFVVSCFFGPEIPQGITSQTHEVRGPCFAVHGPIPVWSDMGSHILRPT